MNRKSWAAGLLIALGCIVNLSVDNRYIGSLIFCIGLFFICEYGLSLYTGKCGYKENLNLRLISILAGNLLAITVVCLLFSLTHINTGVVTRASAIVADKLAKEPIAVALDSFLCGVLMFLAVNNYKRNSEAHNEIGAYLSILFSVPCFILSGYEHSIANMGYLALAIPGMPYTQVLLFLEFITITIIFNCVGSIVARVLICHNPTI